MTEITLLLVKWQSQQSELKALREQVFVIEQHVPADLEWDGLDEAATHLLAVNAANQAVACARILPDGTIGRMAVLKQWRGLGIGRAVLNRAITFCKTQGLSSVHLSAQKHALGFYAEAGFVVTSSEYMDAGIAHYDMKFDISD